MVALANSPCPGVPIYGLFLFLVGFHADHSFLVNTESLCFRLITGSFSDNLSPHMSSKQYHCRSLYHWLIALHVGCVPHASI